MKTAYRVLAYLITLAVVVQAAAIAWAVFGLGHYIDQGAVVDKATQESGETFDGVVGFMVHGINGGAVLPAIGLALLVVSFFVKVRGAIARAAILFGAIAVQVMLGYSAHELPVLGAVHGLLAIGIAVAAVFVGRWITAAAPAVPARAAETIPASPAA